jgi:hypothetical protein
MSTKDGGLPRIGEGLFRGYGGKPGTSGTKMEAYPERMEFNREEMLADQEELGDNQENIEATEEHNNRAPRVKATHVLTAPQGRNSNVLHGDRK